jgi:2-oxo-4-hydroxy-4-carboxy-5-ureidoimidazoline decarboxylase
MTVSTANAVLDRWNAIDAAEAAREILPCCGSRAWAEAVAARRPFGSAEALLAASDLVWSALPQRDWQEAFDSHPRIGQQHAKAATAESLKWSSQEQRAALSQDEAIKAALADGNRRYEEKFERIFIVCASGRSASEILGILERRMNNPADLEMKESAEQQRQITQRRLRCWLGLE